MTDFVCLYNYEFWLSLCKIVRSSVILLLPLSFWKTTKKVPFLPLTTFRSLTNSLTVPQLIDHAERIYNRQRHAFRLNLEIGLILRHTETGEYHILALSTTNLSSSDPSTYPGAKIWTDCVSVFNGLTSPTTSWDRDPTPKGSRISWLTSSSSCITWTIPWGTPVSNCQTTSRRPNRLSLWIKVWIKVWHTETISAPSVVSPCTMVIWETDWKRTPKPCSIDECTSPPISTSMLLSTHRNTKVYHSMRWPTLRNVLRSTSMCFTYVTTTSHWRCTNLDAVTTTPCTSTSSETICRISLIYRCSPRNTSAVPATDTSSTWITWKDIKGDSTAIPRPFSINWKNKASTCKTDYTRGSSSTISRTCSFPSKSRIPRSWRGLNDTIPYPSLFTATFQTSPPIHTV